MPKTIRSRGASLTRRVSAAVVAVSCKSLVASAASNYYVSPKGNDNADGLTPQTAWASLAKVSSTPYEPGSSILFEAGGTWRGQLVASSSGTVSSPITYSSYGVGAKPTFYGSDVLNKGAFAHVPGTASTYAISSTKSVGSVLGNGAFLDSAYLINNRSKDLATNLNYVNTHPNSYYYDKGSKQLYLNTGGSVATDSRQLTAVVQDDLVYSNQQSNLIFDNIITRESAIDNAGYGFRIQNSTNVKITNSEAYSAGKHNFGVINSTEFVGSDLKAAYAMPDQGIGGASAFVSYGDRSFTSVDQSTTWKNITVSNLNGLYDAFLMHGEGLGTTTLANWDVTDSSISLGTGAVASDLRIKNAKLVLGGSSVNRLTLSGANSGIVFYSDGSVTNALISDFTRTEGFAAPINVLGDRNKLAFSTVITGDGQVDNLLQFQTAGAGSIELLGNLFQAYRQTEILWSRSGLPAGQLTADANVYGNTIFRPHGSTLTFAQWQETIRGDYASLLGTAQFIDPLSGDYTLADGTLGTNLVPMSQIVDAAQYDYFGRPRVGPFVDAGAFGGAIPEPTFALAPLVILAFGLRPGRNERLLAKRRT